VQFLNTRYKSPPSFLFDLRLMISQSKWIIIFFFFLSINKTKAQSLLDIKPAFSLTKATIPDAINHLEQQNQIQISYNRANFDISTEITFGKYDQLENLLDVIFDYQVSYIETRNRKILVSPNPRKQIISGIVRDHYSGEKLSGALVYIKDDLSAQVNTNNQGYFTVSSDLRDSIEVVIQYLGFATKTIKLRYPESNLIIELYNDLRIPDIVITDHQTDPSVESVLPIFISDASSFPSLLGEKDVINSLKKYPQINSGSEAQNGLIVRGGATNQNLILMDGVPIYEVSHLGGLSSIIVNDEIRSTDFYASGFPAKYGGRISSVVDISLKEGNNNVQTGNVQASLLGLKGNLEGPLIDSTTSYSLSGRFSWFDTYLRPIITEQTNLSNTELNYFDVHGKITHNFSPSNKVSISAYRGRDEIEIFQNQPEPGNLRFSNNNDLSWGNEMLNVQWSLSSGNKLFIKNQIYRNKYELLSRGIYDFDVINEEQEIEAQELDAITSTNILDYNINSSAEYYYNNRLKLNFGLGYTLHNYEPNIVQSTFILPEQTLIDTLNSGVLKAHEGTAFFQFESNISKKLEAHLGAHLSVFDHEKTYIRLQPRFNINYKINKFTTFKLSGSRMHQNAHLLVNPGTGLPSQLWVPSNSQIGPEQSDEISAAIRIIPSSNIDIQIGVYYRSLSNLIDFEESTDLFGQVLNVVPPAISNEDWADRVVIGEGKARGLEFMANYNKDHLKFWTSLTLAESQLKFPNIRDNEFFPSENDYRIDMNFGSKINITQKFSLSANWVYNHGKRYTLAKEYALLGPDLIPTLLPGLRNDRVFPAFHHLDVNLLWRQPINDKDLVISLGIYNIYNRANPYYFFKLQEEDLSHSDYQLSLFPRLPQLSIEYNF